MDPAEQQLLARMRTLRAAGVTLRGIAADLNRDGFTTRRSTPWRFEYVARVLRGDVRSLRGLQTGYIGNTLNREHG